MPMIKKCYLDTSNKADCVGCEACVQVCAKSAISMFEDEEGFRYPVIDESKCVECGLCRAKCPMNAHLDRYTDDKLAFGGYHRDDVVREQSTSGGAFSAIIESWCDTNYVIFGAESTGLTVSHSYVTDKREIRKFRKSKYAQSQIGTAYKEAKSFLKEGKHVVFSGTPCQIAGLKTYLGEMPCDRLLTIEVVCEGIPSPLYIRKLNKHLADKYGGTIEHLDYRYKDGKRWDFQVMLASITSKSHKYRTFRCDRWFNPFWSIWLNHLMSRPSCYECKFANISRVADITLGDLWGVHLYCPELYGKNGGSSLIVCNTEKGKAALAKCRQYMYGHDLLFEEALCYQSPMRKSISYNVRRTEFMHDLASAMPYDSLVKKWAKRPTLKLLYQKYVWGNRQKVYCWNVVQNIKKLFK